MLAAIIFSTLYSSEGQVTITVIQLHLMMEEAAGGNVDVNVAFLDNSVGPYTCQKLIRCDKISVGGYQQAKDVECAIAELNDGSLVQELAPFQIEAIRAKPDLTGGHQDLPFRTINFLKQGP